MQYNIRRYNEYSRHVTIIPPHDKRLQQLMATSLSGVGRRRFWWRVTAASGLVGLGCLLGAIAFGLTLLTLLVVPVLGLVLGSSSAGLSRSIAYWQTCRAIDAGLIHSLPERFEQLYRKAARSNGLSDEQQNRTLDDKAHLFNEMLDPKTGIWRLHEKAESKEVIEKVETEVCRQLNAIVEAAAADFAAVDAGIVAELEFHQANPIEL